MIVFVKPQQLGSPGWLFLDVQRGGAAIRVPAVECPAAPLALGAGPQVEPFRAAARLFQRSAAARPAALGKNSIAEIS